MRNFNENILNGITETVSSLKSSLTYQPSLHRCLKAPLLNRPCKEQSKCSKENVLAKWCVPLALEVNVVAK